MREQYPRPICFLQRAWNSFVLLTARPGLAQAASSAAVCGVRTHAVRSGGSGTGPAVRAGTEADKAELFEQIGCLKKVLEWLTETTVSLPTGSTLYRTAPGTSIPGLERGGVVRRAPGPSGL